MRVLCQYKLCGGSMTTGVILPVHNAQHTPVCMNTLTVLTTQSMFGQLSLSSDWLVSVKPDTL